jgi:hypothetical protein
MPYKIIKSRYGCRVKSTRKGKAKSKFFSRHAIPCEKAKAQAKLLRAVEHGWKKPKQTRKVKTI